MKKRFISKHWPVVLVGVLLMAGVTWSVTGSPREQHAMDSVPIADAHLHLLDFLQNSGYLLNGKEIPPTAAHTLPISKSHLRLELLLAKMDDANISHAMVSGLPFVKKWSEDDPYRSKYYLDSSSRVIRARDTDYVIALAFRSFQMADPERYKREFPRLFPFICGFNETDLGAVDMIAKRIIEFPGLWKGIGEIMSRHDDLTNLSTGERPRANHPALFRVFDFAGIHGLPVSIHHNIAPVSPGKKDRQMRYLDELLDAFDEFPQTTFIWAHAGISRRIVVDKLTEILDQQVLTHHHNHVLLDLSWVVYEDYLLARDDEGHVIRDEDGDEIIRQEWLDLIHKFPDNFLLGSDKVGDFRTYKEEIRKFNPLLRQLKSGVRERVSSLNWLRIVPKKGITLDPSYKYPETRYIQKSPPRRIPLTPPRSRSTVTRRPQPDSVPEEPVVVP